MSYESLHIFKLIKIKIPCNFLALWNFFLQFSTLFKIKQYWLSPVISMQMHVENQCSSPLRITENIYIYIYIYKQNKCGKSTEIIRYEA